MTVETIPRFKRTDFVCGKVRRLPSLDGWRAISILLVLGAHSTFTVGFPKALIPLFNWLFDGDLGVRTFFIISGFLITWLLLVENGESGQVNLWHFYLRRGLRILPVYGAFLGVLAGLQLLSSYKQDASAWAANLTFSTNFLPHGYWTSGHLWSLAVEEQFYLLWPGIFVLLMRANSLRLALWMLAVPVALAPFCRVVTYLKLAPSGAKFIFTEYSFFNYWDSLAIGCACSYLFYQKRELLNHWLIKKSSVAIFVAISMILIPYVLSRWLVLGIVTVPFGHTFQGCGIALLLMQSLVSPSEPFYRLLNRPLFCKLGVLSYSIYIWQQIFSTNPRLFGWERVWWMSFPGWLVPVFVVALISYYGFERPLLSLRARFRVRNYFVS